MTAPSPSPPRTPTLFLHIGLPKTASTYLQEQIFPHLEGLQYFDRPEDPAFDDPADRQKDSRMMSCMFNRDPRIWADHGDAAFARLLGPQAEWKPRDVLISDEGIGRTGSRPDLLAAHLREMSRLARDWGLGRVAVICAFRRQDHWLGSHYAQMSDRNRAASQADFERAARDLVRPDGQRFALGMMLDYATLHDRLADAVGRKNLLMYPFERQKTDPGGVVADLLAFLEKDLRGPSQRPQPSGTAPKAHGTAPKALGSPPKALGTPAPGVNVRSVGTNRWSIRRFGAGLKVRPYRLARSVGLPSHIALPRFRRPRSFSLSDTASLVILQAYAVCNSTLAARLCIDLVQYGYFEGLGAGGPLGPETPSDTGS